MRRRNKKGQYTKDINWFRVILIGAAFFGLTMYINGCLEIKDNQPIAKPIEVVYAATQTVTPTVVATTTPVVFTQASEQPKNHIEVTSISRPSVNSSKSPEVLTIEEKVQATFSESPQVAVALARAESGMRCNARNVNSNGSEDRGIFQINSVHIKRIQKHGWNLDDMYDCDKNLVIAREIYNEQGFKPWVAYTSGAYLKFLKK